VMERDLSRGAATYRIEISPLRGSNPFPSQPSAHALGYIDVAAPRLARIS
jgi:hypothetical protein